MQIICKRTATYYVLGEMLNPTHSQRVYSQLY